MNVSLSFGSAPRGARCGPGVLLLLVLILSLQASRALAANDRLRMAAPPSEQAAQALLLDIALAGERLVAVGDRGYVLLSDDGGSSWRQADAPVSVMLTAVHFIDEQFGWAVGHGGVVLHSEDGGEHWQLQLDGNRINQAVLQAYRQEIAGLEQRLARTADSSDSTAAESVLEELQYQLEDAELALEEGATKPLLDVWFKSRQEGWVVGAYGLALTTRDGGQTWASTGHRVPNPDGLHFNQLAALDDRTLVIAGEAGRLYQTQDGGAHWEALQSPYEGSFFGVQAVQGGGLLAYGLRGNAFRSMDRGASWQRLDLGDAETVTAALQVDGRVLLLGGGGSLWRADSDSSAFRALPLGRRLPLTGAVPLSPQRLVAVGVGGARVLDLSPDRKED